MNLCGWTLTPQSPVFLIAGPCVIESERLALETAFYLKNLCDTLGIRLIYKSSFDKANRSSLNSFRGLGLEAGLRILARVRDEIGVPVLTDVHEETPLDEVASVVDVLQTPAFLCRQTSFIQRVAAAGKPVNLKKGQFLSPWDMKWVVEKAKAVGNPAIMVCERGASFGYHHLVTDFCAFQIMHEETHCPVIFDVTHSLQMPGSGQGLTGGRREFVPTLARAAVATGFVSGLFIETHPHPEQALSDGATSWPMDQMQPLLEQVIRLDRARKEEITYA